MDQISKGLKDRSSKNEPTVHEEGRTATISGDLDDDFTIHHRPEDDIESLFYVLFWVMILYTGPGGQEREPFDFESSILSQWTESSISNLDAAKDSKNTLMLAHPDKLELASYVSPYFRDLIPLLEDWRELFRAAEYHGRPVEATECLAVLDSHIQRIPYEDDVESTRFAREEKIKSLKGSVLNDPHPNHNGTKKRERETRSMGDTPLPAKRPKDAE